MGGARLRLRTNAETGLDEKPAPVIRRVLVVDGEEPEPPAVDLRGILLQHVAPPREIGGQRPADPVVEQQKTGGGGGGPEFRPARAGPAARPEAPPTTKQRPPSPPRGE